MKIVAIVPAAGSGSRMSDAKMPKQYLDLGGMTILEMTIEALSRSDLIDGIYPVLPPGDVNELSKKLLGLFPKIKEVVAGGASRAESVQNGVVAAESDLVLIHDAARPFVSSSVIRRVVEAASEQGAATAALPVSDTLKEMDGNLIGESVNREKVLTIQTPQVFRRETLLDIYQKKSGSPGEWTDESSMAIEAGYQVAWVPGDPANFKITTDADYELSRRVLGI